MYSLPKGHTSNDQNVKSMLLCPLMYLLPYYQNHYFLSVLCLESYNYIHVVLLIYKSGPSFYCICLCNLVDVSVLLIIYTA